MKTNYAVTLSRALFLAWALCLAGGILAGSPRAWADNCDAGTDSAIAQAKVPHADLHTTTAPGKPPAVIELIFMTDKAYTQVDGAWTSMPYSAQLQIDMVNEAKKRAVQTPRTCEKSGEEPINGEPASLLTLHTEANGKPVEARFWISDKTGLPLKSEAHLANGMVITDEFRYGDIQPPPGVK